MNTYQKIEDYIDGDGKLMRTLIGHSVVVRVMRRENIGEVGYGQQIISFIEYKVEELNEYHDNGGFFVRLVPTVGNAIPEWRFLKKDDIKFVIVEEQEKQSTNSLEDFARMVHNQKRKRDCDPPIHIPLMRPSQVPLPMVPSCTVSKF